MSEGIATFKNVSMGSLCDPRKQEEILNDLWVEWVKLALRLMSGDLEYIVRYRLSGLLTERMLKPMKYLLFAKYFPIHSGPKRNQINGYAQKDK
jgi:hypothetical protein